MHLEKLSIWQSKFAIELLVTMKAEKLKKLSTAATAAAKPRLRGMVFDMDGTLTVPVINFSAMYRAVMGEQEYVRIKSENPSGIETWSPDKQQRAYQIIADFKKQGYDRL